MKAAKSPKSPSANSMMPAASISGTPLIAGPPMTPNSFCAPEIAKTSPATTRNTKKIGSEYRFRKPIHSSFRDVFRNSSGESKPESCRLIHCERATSMEPEADPTPAVDAASAAETLLATLRALLLELHPRQAERRIALDSSLERDL